MNPQYSYFYDYMFEGPSASAQLTQLTEKSSEKRTRRRHKNSHSGCAKCKQRKVRCDEYLPACSNCTRMKFKCPYLELSHSALETMKEDKMLKMNPDPFVNLFIQPNGELRTNRRDEMLIPKLQVKGKDYIRDDVRTYQKDDYVRNFLVDRLRSYQAGEFVKLDYDGNV